MQVIQILMLLVSSTARDACRVDQDIDRAEGLDSEAEQTLPVVLVGDVELEERSTLADLVSGSLVLLGIPLGDNDLAVLIHEPARSAEADALRATSHDGHLSVKTHVMPSPSSCHAIWRGSSTSIPRHRQRNMGVADAMGSVLVALHQLRHLLGTA